jgi:hypothetical protein
MLRLLIYAVAVVALACVAPSGALATGTGIVKGSFTVPSGVSPTNVQVSLLDPEGNQVGDQYATLGGTSTTGDYEFDNLMSGQYELVFRDPQNADNLAPAYYSAGTAGGTLTLASASPITVSSGVTTTNSTVTALLHGGVISGTVSDGNTGTEDAGDTNILACSTAPVQDPWTACSFDIYFSGSTYSIEGVPPGTYNVFYSVESASGPSYDDELYVASGGGVSYDAGAATAVTVSSGSSETLNFSVPRFGSIAGSITDPGGVPSGGEEVLIYDGSGQKIRSFNSAGDGTYTAGGVLPGGYRLWFRSEPDAPVAWQFYSGQPTLPLANVVSVGAGQAVTGINITYAPQSTISGTVTSGGVPLGGISVYALDSEGDIVTGTTTAANGTYTITNLPAGAFYVAFGAVAPNFMGADDTPDFISGSLSWNGAAYAPIYYGGTPTIAGATAITLSAGQQLTGINAALGPFTTAAAPAPPQAPSAVAPAFAPTVSGGSLAGLSKRRPVLKLALASGSKGAPDLVSFKLTLPAGFGFNKSKLGKDLALGGVAHGYTLKGRSVTIYLSKPRASVKLTIKAGGLTASEAIGKSAKKRKIKSEILKLSATDIAGTTRSISVTIKKPH